MIGFGNSQGGSVVRVLVSVASFLVIPIDPGEKCVEELEAGSRGGQEVLVAV
jgi:hypothetical protein